MKLQIGNLIDGIFECKRAIDGLGNYLIKLHPGNGKK